MSQEAKVGLLAVISLIVLYLGFNFLKGSDVFSRSNIYYVEYDNIDGLANSNPVLLNGLSVGRVKTIELLPENNNHLRVTIDVQKAIQIPEGSKAILADGGLMGGKVIRLDMGPDRSKLIPHEGTIAAGKDIGLMTLLQAQATPVLASADSLMANLTVVSAGFKDTGEKLNNILTNFDATSQSLNGILKDNRGKLASLIGNMNTLSASLIETEKGIKPLLANANNLVDSLNAVQIGKTINQANKTLTELHTLIAGIKSGDGTAGKLLTDDKMYNNLNYTLISLNQLLANFRENPKRYINVSVFGKKGDKGPTVSEIDTVLQFKTPETN